MAQLARANAALGEFSKAEALYKQILEKKKDFQAAYSELYKLFIFQRKLSEGEQVLKAAFQNNPKQFGFLTTLALHYSLVGRQTTWWPCCR